MKDDCMTQEINSSSHATRTARLGALGALALAAALAAGQAHAACNVVFSVANVQMGSMSVSSLRASSVPGYRLINTRNQTVNVNCNAPQATLRLALSGLTPVTGQPLVRWGSVGAMQVRALGASAAGVAVNIKLEGAPGSVYAQTLDFTKNDVVEFDLSSVPLSERKSFSLQLQLTGLLPESHAVRSQETLDSSFSVQLLGAK